MAAGKFVRIAGFVVGLQAAVIHDLVNIIIELCLGHQVMLAHSLTDDLTNRQTRGQAGERVLEDDLHLGTQVTQLPAGHIVHFFAVEQYLTAGFFAGKAQDCTAGGGFAAAGFADQTHGMAALEVEGNAIDSLDMTHGLGHQAALDGEVFFKLVDHQNILIIIGDGGIVQLFCVFCLCHRHSPAFRLFS